MSTLNRFLSAAFTAIPACFFFILFLMSDWLGREYWWATYLVVLIVLLCSSLLFGFTLPSLFQKLRIGRPWIWIIVQGLLAWAIAFVFLGLLNLTPLCVGQDNGDGNNNLSMCVFMTALDGIIYTPLYLGLLAISAWIGYWMLSSQLKRSGT
jgi:hypothetical protein